MGFFGFLRLLGEVDSLSRGTSSPIFPIPSIPKFQLPSPLPFILLRFPSFIYLPRFSVNTSLTPSLLFMFETQPNWYHIRPLHSLGWHVGFWNFIGGLGFTLCGAFGIAQAQMWAEYQSGCSTFWGGWAFLIGSICQWIE